MLEEIAKLAEKQNDIRRDIKNYRNTKYYNANNSGDPDLNKRMNALHDKVDYLKVKGSLLIAKKNALSKLVRTLNIKTPDDIAKESTERAKNGIEEYATIAEIPRNSELGKLF